jgi:mono/diheme cytochrome c family protein
MSKYGKSRPANWRPGVALTAAVVLLLALPQDATSFPIDGDQAVLPAGSELDEDAVYVPHEVLHSEYLGHRLSYEVALGDLAFNSPKILGDVARRAKVSCATCHVNGAGNAKLFVPGLSTRPGTFDTTGALFNPKADNYVFDPVRIPSLRGARYLAPYGHDGRTASLRDFVRNVIVGEFAGPEPSPAVLDAIVAYVQEIDFLPNLKLGARGRLNDTADEAERRGEALFAKPFRHDPNLSCAGCHPPAGGFVDHLQHDVGSDGLHKSPTLLNANFNAPYFHDGRYDGFDQAGLRDRWQQSGRRGVAAERHLAQRHAEQRRRHRARLPGDLRRRRGGLRSKAGRRRACRHRATASGRQGPRSAQCRYREAARRQRRAGRTAADGRA